MTALAMLSEGDLHTLVGEFAALTWPADRSAIEAAAERLGWQVEMSRAKGIDFVANYSGFQSWIRARLSDDCLAAVKVEATDRLADSAGVAAAYEALSQALAGILGAAASDSRRGTPRKAWDLVNGGRVTLSAMQDVVLLGVLQESYADIERFEENRGIPADRDLGDSD